MKVLISGHSLASRTVIKVLSSALVKKHSVMVPHMALPVNRVVSELFSSERLDLVIVFGFSAVFSEFEKEEAFVKAAVKNNITVFVVEYEVNSSLRDQAGVIAKKVDHLFVSSRSSLSIVSRFGYASSTYICRPSQIIDNSRKIIEVMERRVSSVK